MDNRAFSKKYFWYVMNTKNKLQCLHTAGLSLIQCGKEIPCNVNIDILEKSEYLKLIGFLEKNESYIYWFQPSTSKSIDDQTPALKIHDNFYFLSMRMMKAVWRHVRLKKNFKNIERAQSGGFKLKIPWALWIEKKRTQIRFHVQFYKDFFIYLYKIHI